MPSNQINLLPESQIKSQRSTPYLDLMLQYGPYALVASYALVLAVFGWRWYNESELDEVNASIKQKKAFIKQNQQFVRDFNKFKDRFTTVGKTFLTQSSQNKRQYLTLIEETIPKNVRLSSLDITGNQISISATTDQYLAAEQWKNDLEREQEQVRSVSLGSIGRGSGSDSSDNTQDSAQSINFSLKINLLQ